MKMKNVAFFMVIISLTMIGCDDNKNEGEQKKLAHQIVDSMVVVEGGRYQMGDFGALVGEKLPFSPDIDNKPLHWVDVSNFKITKNRTTWGQFNKWLKINNRKKTPTILGQKIIRIKISIVIRLFLMITILHQ